MIPSRLSLVLTGTAFVALELWHSFLVTSHTYPMPGWCFLDRCTKKISVQSHIFLSAIWYSSIFEMQRSLTHLKDIVCISVLNSPLLLSTLKL
jgi:hypothetical protein